MFRISYYVPQNHQHLPITTWSEFKGAHLDRSAQFRVLDGLAAQRTVAAADTGVVVEIDHTDLKTGQRTVMYLVRGHDKIHETSSQPSEDARRIYQPEDFPPGWSELSTDQKALQKMIDAVS